jgi:hypothetical protein
MKVCFDIDGVLCDQVGQDYEEAQPNRPMIELLNRLYDRGDHIVLHTSRFMGRTKGNREEAERMGREFTERQLAGWGVRYHELWMGKPRYDYVIDDRSVFYDDDCSRIEAYLESRAGSGAK